MMVMLTMEFMGAKILNCANSIEYYFYAENDSTGVFSPERSSL